MRLRGIYTALAAVVLTAGVGGGIYLVVDQQSPPADAAGQIGHATTSAEPVGSPASGSDTGAGAHSSPSPATASPPHRIDLPRPAAPKLKPSPSRRPVTIVGPPPPAPDPSPTPAPTGASCPWYDGANAPHDQVGAALEAAAAHRFWTVSDVSLPQNLIKAIADQESGWQSAIIACDGGIGTMQIMSNTASWMNQRFGTAYDVHRLDGNTMIGSAYLQWLIKYFGDVYFNGDYTIRAGDCQQDPNVPDYLEPCLLNAVIASYNYGYGAVDDAATGQIVIPNPQYVANVRALMAKY